MQAPSLCMSSRLWNYLALVRFVECYCKQHIFPKKEAVMGKHLTLVLLTECYRKQHKYQQKESGEAKLPYILRFARVSLEAAQLKNGSSGSTRFKFVLVGECICM